MKTKLSRDDEVMTGTDALVRRLVQKANKTDDVDFALSVVHAATKWVQVKNRLIPPEEDNAFDEWRNDLADTGGDGGHRDLPATSADGVAVGGSNTEPAAPKPKGRVSTAASRAARRHVNNLVRSSHAGTH